MNTVEVEIGGRTIKLETGRLAKQANGAVLVTCGDTVVLVTAVGREEVREGQSFFPLTVDVEERHYAAGKIPGGFIKRESRPSEKAILACRQIDRPIRPLFKKGFMNEVHVVATVLSVDMENAHDILATIGASAALTLSEIPFGGPVGSVRVGRIEDEFVINPTLTQIEEESEFDLVVTGTRDAIVMVEAGADQVPEAVIVEALRLAHDEIKKLVDVQLELQRQCGKPKWDVAEASIDEAILAEVRAGYGAQLDAATQVTEKRERQDAVAEVNRVALEALLDETSSPERGTQVRRALAKIERDLIRDRIAVQKRRPDGRGTDEIRTITCEVGLIPRTHGSALFTRGQTQALSLVTLGGTGEFQRIDGLGIEDKKRYMHHYNFPPYSVGETGFMRGPKRRDIGHGALAERALLPVLPSELDFPYTTRIVSEILESNGSSSMASVCGSTLSLMDAGVQIKAPVAGIAMGLIKEGDDYVILTDIAGVEDHLGDMDFKVAGTAEGITALQMDIKITGVTFEILTEALEQAR
jgi:polyribonucleotide nucleotidyltransferase